MLVVSPLVLVLLGLLVARIAKGRRVWRRHSLLTAKAGVVLLVFYTAVSLAFLFDTPNARAAALHLGSVDGTHFFFGSGLVPFGVTWPVTDMRLMALAIVSFMLYPFWYWLGVNAGFWLFGRSPKQTGILGLLR